MLIEKGGRHGVGLVRAEQRGWQLGNGDLLELCACCQKFGSLEFAAAAVAAAEFFVFSLDSVPER